MSEGERVRLDRWLWAARFYKTRAKAKTAIEGGKVQFHPTRTEANDTSSQVRPKVSKEIGIGDMLSIRRNHRQIISQTVVITGLSEKRGNATAAASLYRETDHSIEARESERSRQAMQRVGLTVPERKPSKRDRRALQKLKADSSAQ